MNRPRLPKTHKQLDELQQRSYDAGYRAATSYWEAKIAADKAGFVRQQQEERLAALKAARELASALGQSIGELARAMCSEAGQL